MGLYPRKAQEGIIAWTTRLVADGARPIGPDGVEQGSAVQGKATGLSFNQAMFVLFQCPLPWAGHSVVPPSLAVRGGPESQEERGRGSNGGEMGGRWKVELLDIHGVHGLTYAGGVQGDPTAGTGQYGRKRRKDRSV